ncbi:hypothetical protein LSH36_500g00027 [Paralvinella palmiformis]|uniref:Exocyst complex component 7 n=1 Tax=Paralvinella palmiformis TaxID=53620 RepID=A0AAD9J9X7_9ANNE|nr:hypothetical protein LSH36_500g00027 [Paralvinella palmiformis]
MEEIPTFRNGTKDKLEKEKENLAQLRDLLHRSDLMTQNMLGILGSFETRLGSPSSGLSPYLECMEKLQKAVQYFNKHNQDSPEMADVVSLYEAGRNALEKEFHKILQTHSKPVPAVLMLDVFSAEDDEEPPIIEHFPQRVHNELKLISSWLQRCDATTDYLSVYASVRSHAVVKSLQCLKDHLKSGSRDSTRDSPALMSKFSHTKDTLSSKKALKRMAFVKKASTAIMKSKAHLEAAGSDLKDEGIDIDIDIYLTSVSALLKLIQSEWILMQGLLPDKHQRKIFDMLVQAGLETIVREGEQISAYIKRATLRHNTAAIINIFPVLKHLRAIKPEYDVTLENCQAPTRAKLPTLISTLDATGAKALEDFVDSVRNDPDKVSNMPKDGTVHELTSNFLEKGCLGGGAPEIDFAGSRTMIFLEQLIQFADVAGAMLLSQDPNLLADITNVDRHLLKLAHFLTQVLSNLALNLDNKSETYSDETLKSIFLLNNYNYMLKTLKRSGMLDVVHMWNNEVSDFLSNKILEQKRIYSQRNNVLELVHLLNPNVELKYAERIDFYRKEYTKSWSRVLYYLAENQQPAVGIAGADGKLKDKERQIIKDRFVGFNRELEEIIRVQKSYSIPDPELRESLRKDNRDYILPFFRSFMRKYEGSHFTKNPEKYVKHRESDVLRFLNNFFDVRA